MKTNKYGITSYLLDNKFIIQIFIEEYNYEIYFENEEDFNLKTNKQFDNFNMNDFFEFYKN